jgi:hypothetical protein
MAAKKRRGRPPKQRTIDDLDNPQGDAATLYTDQAMAQDEYDEEWESQEEVMRELGIDPFDR